MQLKNYQLQALDTLGEFLGRSLIKGIETAFNEIVNDPQNADRLGAQKSDYKVLEALPDTPRVCIKIPTGGGKTIIAAHAIKIISEIWQTKNYPFVLWFTPTDIIRKQTAEALKTKGHPYRDALDALFGQVEIYDIDQKFGIRPKDIAQNACVIVSTIQSFVKENTAKYNVYKDNENLESHFVQISAIDGMELTEDKSRVKYSFANLLRYHRPIMIIDEAHKAVTDLSYETQKRINPCAIIELTATPQPNNNTLYSARASELKNEEMIKLPIALIESREAEQIIADAILRRAELERIAQDEKEYIRPIVLFQAQSKDKEFNVDWLKDRLTDSENIPPKEIAIATGEQKELNNIDIFDCNCQIKYIITVEALKEGWDCSFAYILCSLTNIKSDTAVEQLLGRVMRMPYAKRRKNAALNKAYAYARSSKFGEAASALVEKLGKKGFSEEEAKSVVQFELPLNTKINEVELSSPLIIAQPPSGLNIDGNMVIFSPSTTEASINELCKNLDEDDQFKIKRGFSIYKKREDAPSFAKNGKRLAIPKLKFWTQGEFIFADPEEIFALFEWDLCKFAKTKLSESDFKIEKRGDRFIIDIDGQKLRYLQDRGNQNSIAAVVVVESWTRENLIIWLDKRLHRPDIIQQQTLKWLSEIIDHLNDVRGITITELTAVKTSLAFKLKGLIEIAVIDAKKSAHQLFLFSPESRTMVDFQDAFDFDANMYDGEEFYAGSYQFSKSYLGANKVPCFDGKPDGEEFQCAQALDRLDEVEYWTRNVAKHNRSFRLPTSTDSFYPDFVALLKDGRLLIVEYKRADMVSNDDTKEKKLYGELWERDMKGKGLFMIASIAKGGKTITEQILSKIKA